MQNRKKKKLSFNFHSLYFFFKKLINHQIYKKINECCDDIRRIVHETKYQVLFLLDFPLQDGSVTTTCGDDVTVIKGESHIGHVSRVATVFLERSILLGDWISEQLDKSKVITSGNNLSVLAHVQCVHISLVAELGPDAGNVVAKHTSERSPLFNLLKFLLYFTKVLLAAGSFVC